MITKRQRSPALSGTEMTKKKALYRPARGQYPNAINLCRFISLILGRKISNRQIALRWKMDEKNFHEMRVGRYPVPRIKRLIGLAKMLGVNKHLVYEVADGRPAGKVFKLIKNRDLKGQIKLLGFYK